MMAEWSTQFISIRICNIKSIRYNKLKKMAKKLIFGYLDHPKCVFFLYPPLPSDQVSEKSYGGKYEKKCSRTDGQTTDGLLSQVLAQLKLRTVTSTRD